VFPAPALLAGAESLAPDLEIVRRLDGGSTADVYLAREPGLQRLVAVKVLRQELVHDSVALHRFMREARAAARVTHPNVTAIHRIGQLPGGIPYIVMEYIDGRTVAEVLAASGPMPLQEALPLLASVAAALAAVHDCGIVHRDVQPGNVFLENRTGRAVLGDFGIAALLEGGSARSELTAVGMRVGDIRYMSPERIRGAAASERSDVYALGMLAYEVLTGRAPWDSQWDTDLIAAHLTAPPRPLVELRPGLDAGAARLIEQCLAKEPNYRPRAHDLVQRLGGPGQNADHAGGELSPAAHFLAELRRRRVYQVLVGYGAFSVALLGAAEVFYEAFDLSQRVYQIIAMLALAGFPFALMLAWAYDITSAGIRRTPDTAASARFGMLKWIALAVSTVAAAGIGWFLLRP
jgi:serine/threonine protein kinase